MTALAIDAALDDPKLLGAALGDPAPWSTWRSVLRAAWALPLDDIDRQRFDSLAGGREPPSARVAELWVVAGRRSGKSRMAAAVAAFLSTFADYRRVLAAGETGHVLVLAPTRAQSRTIHDYIAGFLQESPILRQQVLSVGADEIRLRGNICITVQPPNFRSIRGRTLIAAILDECSFWRDETSAAPDIEAYRAILPGLATTGGMLVGISSPYRKVGLLHAKHRDHFGRDGDVLVIKAPTMLLNPTIDAAVIARAKESDPEAARAEWDGEFRGDLSSMFDDALIDAAVEHSRPLELPPRNGVKYHAFADISGGRHDASTLAIGHFDEGRFICDVMRGQGAPHDPKAVVGEFAALAKAYGVTEVTGDNYAGEWVATAFRDAGMTYTRSELARSGLYLEALPHFAREAVRIPDHHQLVRELRLLERRTSRSGRDSVDHPQGGTDDYANALAGCIHITMRPGIKPAVAVFGTYCDQQDYGPRQLRR